MYHFRFWMQKKLKRNVFILFAATTIVFIFITFRAPKDSIVPKLYEHQNICPPLHVSTQTITPLKNTTHLLVSAYVNTRGFKPDLRILGIFKKDSIQPLYCTFCCTGTYTSAKKTGAFISQHSENFGFPYVTTDVTCEIPPNCKPTHVSLLPDLGEQTTYKPTWLPIRNHNIIGKEKQNFKYNFTVCISSLFGDYNNVLQAAQTLEMYRLLGIDRVVIYNTSCSKEFARLLHSYSQEGFVEVVPWPIDKHLNPSHGWLFSESGGDLHYFGQLTTLNECIHRSMDSSRYVLLNDMDEIIMPYQHNDLNSLMKAIDVESKKIGEFHIENHIFPKTRFDPSQRFHLPQWAGVPGINILEHIYREEPDRKIYHPYKMIVNPRLVEQTSVHEVLKNRGERYSVPPDVCRIIHVRTALQNSLTLEQLNVDKRLWDFQQKLIPNVDKALKRVGLLRPF